MAYTTIDKPSKYFTPKTYTGTGATQSITGLEFSPDFVWIKNRSGANSHGLVNSLVNTRYALDTSATSGEVDFSTSGVTSLNSDGFTVVSHPVFNGSGNNYISWNWDANGTGVSNTAGSITSTVSANTTSGFSIVSYTGNGTSGATIGHGLGVTPSMIFIKNRPATSSGWRIFHKSLGLSSGVPNYLLLPNNDGSQTGDTGVFYSSPTSTLFSVGNYGQVNASGETLIAYCFSEVKGYSKFGSYTGNGSTNGTFVYTGFSPAFLMIKQTNTSGENWYMWDNKRATYNVADNRLYPNLSNSEDTTNLLFDFLSNGFKLRSTYTGFNQSGGTFVYMAFASNPFTSSKGIPTTAR